MAQQRDTVYRIPGVQDDEGNQGTLTITVRKGGPDKAEFEADAQVSSGEEPSGEELPPSSEKVDELPADGPDDAPTAGQLPADQPTAGQLPADQPEGGDEPHVEHR
jgi:hypothetical protein